MDLTIRGLKVDAGSGPGSRGGHVIGKTSSGKPIYASAGHPSHQKFTPDEHAEAYHVQMDKSNQASDRGMNKRYAARHGGARAESTRPHESKAAHHAEQAKVHLAKSVNANVLGKTSSGKTVYRNADHPSHANFTSREHIEAEELHEPHWQANRKVSGETKNAQGKFHGEQARAHGDLAFKLHKKENAP